MSHPQPIPCAQCGTNFMRHNLDPEFPKLCNNCLYKAQQNQPKGEKKSMADMKILIEVDRQTNIEIEEKCMNEGITISEYFMRLHRANISERYLSKGIQEFEEGFEKLAHHRKLEPLQQEEPKFSENPQKSIPKRGKK